MQNSEWYKKSSDTTQIILNHWIKSCSGCSLCDELQSKHQQKTFRCELTSKCKMAEEQQPNQANYFYLSKTNLCPGWATWRLIKETWLQILSKLCISPTNKNGSKSNKVRRRMIEPCWEKVAKIGLWKRSPKVWLSEVGQQITLCLWWLC